MTTCDEAQRATERIRTLLDRSVATYSGHKDGGVQFDGFRVSLFDAFKLDVELKIIENFLKENKLP